MKHTLIFSLNSCSFSFSKECVNHKIKFWISVLTLTQYKQGGLVIKQQIIYNQVKHTAKRTWPCEILPLWDVFPVVGCQDCILLETYFLLLLKINVSTCWHTKFLHVYESKYLLNSWWVQPIVHYQGSL